MKRTVYINISNKTSKMRISKNPSYRPLDQHGIYYPTIRIKLNLEIPDELFEKANEELTLNIEKANISSEIKIEQGEEKDEINQ